MRFPPGSPAVLRLHMECIIRLFLAINHRHVAHSEHPLSGRLILQLQLKGKVLGYIHDFKFTDLSIYSIVVIPGKQHGAQHEVRAVLPHLAVVYFLLKDGLVIIC